MAKKYPEAYSFTFTRKMYRNAMWTYFAVTVVLFIIRVILLYMYGQDFRVTPLNALLFTGHVLSLGLLIQLGRVKKRSVEVKCTSDTL